MSAEVCEVHLGGPASGLGWAAGGKVAPGAWPALLHGVCSMPSFSSRPSCPEADRLSKPASHSAASPFPFFLFLGRWGWAWCCNLMLVGTKLNSFGLPGKKMASDRQQRESPRGFACSCFSAPISPSHHPLFWPPGSSAGKHHGWNIYDFPEMGLEGLQGLHASRREACSASSWYVGWKATFQIPGSLHGWLLQLPGRCSRRRAWAVQGLLPPRGLICSPRVTAAGLSLRAAASGRREAGGERSIQPSATEAEARFIWHCYGPNPRVLGGRGWGKDCN